MKRRNFILSMLAACVIGCSSPVSPVVETPNENIVEVLFFSCTGNIDDSIVISQDNIPIDTLFYADDTLNTKYGVFYGNIFVDSTKIIQINFSCNDGKTPRFDRYINLNLINHYTVGKKTIGYCICRN